MKLYPLFLLMATLTVLSPGVVMTLTNSARFGLKGTFGWNSRYSLRRPGCNNIRNKHVIIHCLYALFAKSAKIWLSSERIGMAINRMGGAVLLFFGTALAFFQEGS